MRNLYGHHFTLKPGARVYIPTHEGRALGEAVKSAIEKKWSAPTNYFHLLPGGHVAAARRHQHASIVAALDLRRFFEHITRSKVHRVLKSIGYPHTEAWEMACNSCVDKHPPQRKFSVPFGFVQSPAVASLVLAKSNLGREISKLNSAGYDVSVYVDDITVSGPDEQTVDYIIATLTNAVKASGFEFNTAKQQGPGSSAVSFNIEFGAGTFRIIPDRIAEFEVAVRNANPFELSGILSYVASVNSHQENALALHAP